MSITERRTQEGVPYDGKHGRIEGGLVNDEVLNSSDAILKKAWRGNFKGVQQWFTPAHISSFVADILGRHIPVLDTTAGSGAMLAAFNESMRYGIEFDQDHTRSKPNYHVIEGDAQRVVPMLRAVGVKFPRIAINPPYGLTWKDSAHTKSADATMNSTVMAYLWAQDLLQGGGHGAILCGTENLIKIMQHEQGRGVYAVMNLPSGSVWKSVESSVSLAFYVKTAVLDEAKRPETYRMTETLDPEDSLTMYRSQVREARMMTGSYSRNHFYPEEIDLLRERWDDVAAEYKRRKTIQEGKHKPTHDVAMSGSKKLHVYVQPYPKILLAKEQQLDFVQMLDRQSVSYFAQSPREWNRLLELENRGLLTISPEVREKASAAVASADRILVPLQPVPRHMALGWLPDQDHIECKEGDDEKGFVAGASYRITTEFYIEKIPKDKEYQGKEGPPSMRKTVERRKLLRVNIKNDAGVTHDFNESQANVTYLDRHFVLPDPGDVATSYPEEYQANRKLLDEIEADWRVNHARYMTNVEGKRPMEEWSEGDDLEDFFTPFSYKEYQKDNLARLFMKERGMLAHEQGLGKTLMQLTLAEMHRRKYGTELYMQLAPQDLIPQWQREAMMFTGRTFEVIKSPDDAIRLRRKIRGVKNAPTYVYDEDAGRKVRVKGTWRVQPDPTGWYITHYECLSGVGISKNYDLPTVRLNRREDLKERLYTYKKIKEEKKKEGVAWNVGAIRAPEPPKEARPKKQQVYNYERAEYQYIEEDAATSRWACPKCKTDTANGWTGIVCRNNPQKEGQHGCGYVHRGLLTKAAGHHLRDSFRKGVVNIDELAEMRGDTSRKSKAVRPLNRGPGKYGATGTPLSNYISDSFWLLWWCLGDASAMFPYTYDGGRAKFENDFAVMEDLYGKIGTDNEDKKSRTIVLPKITNVSQFWRLTQPSVSRLRKEQTGEPIVPKHVKVVEVPQGVVQKKVGDFWMQNFVSYFSEMHPDHELVRNGMVDKFEKSLGLGWRLETAATLPSSDTPTLTWRKAKEQDWWPDLSPWTPAILKVLELAGRHAEAGEKVLVGSDLIAPGNFLAEEMSKKGIPSVHMTEETGIGETRKIATKNPKKRAGAVEEFVRGKASCLFVGVNAMKLGHNLDCASVVIVHGLPYSHMTMDQFLARVHRLTSKKPVTVYIILPENTLAEGKWELLKDKAGSANLAYDGSMMDQPEEQEDLAKVVQAMKERGILPEGNEIHERDVKRQWDEMTFKAPPVRITSARSHRKKQGPGLLDRLVESKKTTIDSENLPYKVEIVGLSENPVHEQHHDELAKKRSKRRKKDITASDSMSALFDIAADGTVAYTQESLF